MKSLAPWFASGIIAHVFLWLLLSSAVDSTAYLSMTLLIFSLPLSICTNHGKSASNKLKEILGVLGPVSASNLYKQALKRSDSEVIRLAERYWLWQAWASFWAGFFLFWGLVLIRHFLT